MHRGAERTGTSETRLSVGSGPERPAATKEQQEREEQRTCETWPIRAGPQAMEASPSCRRAGNLSALTETIAWTG
jgi:hypothetical protein